MARPPRFEASDPPSSSSRLSGSPPTIGPDLWPGYCSTLMTGATYTRRRFGAAGDSGFLWMASSAGWRGFRTTPSSSSRADPSRAVIFNASVSRRDGQPYFAFPRRRTFASTSRKRPHNKCPANCRAGGRGRWASRHRGRSLRPLQVVDTLRGARSSNPKPSSVAAPSRDSHRLASAAASRRRVVVRRGIPRIRRSPFQFVLW
jgi:hypothetical protein